MTAVMAIDIRDRTLIVTGASAGIGAATALAAAEAGMHVVISARRADRLEALAERVRAVGRHAEVVVGDVTDRLIDEQMFAAADRLGGLYAVFSNAGYGFERPTVDLDEAALREIFEVNFFSSLRLVRSAAKHLLESERRGHLLLCSSCVAKFTLPRFAAYSATKSAQNLFARAMRHELRPHGIEVSSVHPITTTTEFFEVSAKRSGRERPISVTPEHAPKFFVQPPQRVARAIIRCLRRPRSEVWTSHIVRTVAGVMNAWPGFLDMVMAVEAKRQFRADAKSPPH